MALGLNWPLTLTRKADNLTTFMWCLEIWEPQTPGTFWECNRPVMGLFHPLYTIICNLSTSREKKTVQNLIRFSFHIHFNIIVSCRSTSRSFKRSLSFRFASKNSLCISQLYPRMLQAPFFTAGRYNTEYPLMVTSLTYVTERRRSFDTNGDHLYPMVTTFRTKTDDVTSFFQQ
jgi:hypothetical protein